MLLCLVLLLGSVGAWGQTEMKRRLEEYHIKAEYLKLCAEGTTWLDEKTADKGKPFVVGLFVPDELVRVFYEDVQMTPELKFDALAKSKIKDRQVVVKRCVAPQDVKGCHLVFVSSAEEGKAAKVLQEGKGSSVLTVGESSTFEREGGVIAFVRRNKNKEKDTVGFHINTGALKPANLTMTMTLLRMGQMK